MDPVLLLSGVAMGLSMAMPLGPVNVMVIRSAIRRGLVGGLAAGLGSLAADTMFALIAAYGIRSIERLFIDYATPFRLVGGVLLVVIGIRTARSHVAAMKLKEETPASAAKLWRKALTCFSATVSNPGSLLGVFAVFGAMSSVLRLDSAPYRPLIAVIGFVAGGLLWWLFLSFAVHHLRNRLSPALLDRINHWAGILVAAFGFALLMQIFA